MPTRRGTDLRRAEERAFAIWVDLQVARVRDGLDSPELDRIAHAAWRAFLRLSARRCAVE